MIMQERSDKRSLELHREVVKLLRLNPSLWDVPLRNIDRWTDKDGSLPVPYKIWKEILTSMSHETIIKLVLSKSQRSTQLRSSSPFTGIIDKETRNKIFQKYKMH
jgi:hypothetical protein